MKNLISFLLILTSINCFAQTTYFSDGTWSTTNDWGNTYNSDGSWSTTNSWGNTYYSDGSSSTTSQW